MCCKFCTIVCPDYFINIYNKNSLLKKLTWLLYYKNYIILGKIVPRLWVVEYLYRMYWFYFNVQNSDPSQGLHPNWNVGMLASGS